MNERYFQCKTHSASDTATAVVPVQLFVSGKKQNLLEMVLKIWHAVNKTSKKIKNSRVITSSMAVSVIL